MIDRLLDDPRVRIVLFAGVTLLLLAVFAWSIMGGGEEELPPSDDTSAPASDSAPSQAPEREPTTQPSDLPPPVPVPDPEKEAKPPVVTPDDVEKFLRAINTFTARDLADAYTKSAVATGAVPGSPASRPWLTETELDQCIVDVCSSEAVAVSNIQIDPAGSASGLVKVRKSIGSQEFPVTMFCTVDLARGSEARPGLFVMADCYRGA